MSGIIDQRTLDLLRARDPQTLAQAVDAHHAALLGVCYGLGWQGSQAEDLVQDTWLTFLKSLDSFEGRSSLKTYLIGILYHKSMEQRRFTQREQVADPIDEIFEERFGFWGLWRDASAGPGRGVPRPRKRPSH